MIDLIILCVLGVGVLGLMGYLLYTALTDWGRYSLINDTKQSPAAEVPEGRVKVRGELSADRGQRLLKSPISRKKCVYYFFAAQQVRSYDRTTREGDWRVTRRYYYKVNIAEHAEQVPCVLRDGSGEVPVDLEGAVAEVADDTWVMSGMFSDLDEEEQGRIFELTGVSNQGLFWERDLLFLEVAIPEGAGVMVIGEAAEGEHGVEIAKGGGQLLVSDMEEADLTEGLRPSIWMRLIVLFALPIIILWVAVGSGMVSRAFSGGEPPRPPEEEKKDGGKKDDKFKMPDYTSIDYVVSELKKPDKWGKVRAADALHFRIKVDPARRAEVLAVLNEALAGSAAEDRTAIQAAIKTWSGPPM